MGVKVVAALQVRLGSRRMPKKALSPILGKSMTEHIVDRLRLARTVDEVVIATSDDPSDDPLVELAGTLGLGCSRGPVDDLAQRLLGAVGDAGGDVLVRVWGDCPCIDPALIDLGVSRFLDEQADYLSNAVIVERSYPYGLDFEVYRRSLLERIAKASDDPFFREFPEELVKADAAVRKLALVNETDESRIHVTVDYPEDFALMTAIYRHLYRPGQAFGHRELVRLHTEHPELGWQVSELPRNPEYHAKLKERLGQLP